MTTQTRSQLSRIKPRIVILGFLAIALTQRAADAGPPPKAVFFGSGGNLVSTTSRFPVFVDLVPTPGQVITTTGQSTILVEFFGSARLSEPGASMDVRATIDGKPLFSTNGRTSSGSSIGYSAFVTNVGPGQHTVTMQWNVTGGTGFMLGRTFIVWVFPQ